MKHLVLYKLLRILVLVVLMNSACSSDRFVDEVDIEEENFTPLLAVQAVYTMGEEDFYLYASKTQKNQTENINSISFETQLVDSDGIILFDSSCVNCLSMVFNIGSLAIVADNTYHLTVSSEGTETAFASITPSLAPQLELKDFERKGYNLLVNFNIIDRENVNEFYRIRDILIFGEAYSFTRRYSPSEEVGIYFESTYPRGLILPDASFAGESFRINTKGSFYREIDTFNVEIIVENWSQDLYNYGKSVSAIEGAERNPFSEPVSINGNFRNGLGIFAIIQLDTLRARKLL